MFSCFPQGYKCEGAHKSPEFELGLMIQISMTIPLTLSAPWFNKMYLETYICYSYLSYFCAELEEWVTKIFFGQFYMGMIGSFFHLYIFVTYV